MFIAPPPSEAKLLLNIVIEFPAKLIWLLSENKVPRLAWLLTNVTSALSVNVTCEFWIEAIAAPFLTKLCVTECHFTRFFEYHIRIVYRVNSTTISNCFITRKCYGRIFIK